MRIQIDGTNTQNKGAELMLIAILEQVEKKYPQAEVLLNSIYGHPREIKTSLTLKKTFFLKFAGRFTRVTFRMLGHPFYPLFSEFRPLKHIDLLLDASGFRLSDQWHYAEGYYDRLDNYYRKLKQYGTKIILLPQAFGPFHTELGKRGIGILNRYADLVIAREAISMNYLVEAGINNEKVVQYPDFTLMVKGVLPERYQSLKGQVCIIPNKKMITHTELTEDTYVSNLISLITLIRNSGKKVFLLNHEGKGDLELCRQISNKAGGPLTVVSGLDAKEVKGVIGAALLVISSRYHGVASALNQGIPCLATSWSHKYEMLFLDFGLSGFILDMNKKPEELWQITEPLLNPAENSRIRNLLSLKKTKLNEQTQHMWQLIWDKANLSFP